MQGGRVLVGRSGGSSTRVGLVQYSLLQRRLACGRAGPRRRLAATALLPPAPDPTVQAGLIVAGWDRHEGGSVYAIPLGGTLVKCPFTIGGSGSAYIYGLCDKLWRVRGHCQRAGRALRGLLWHPADAHRRPAAAGSSHFNQPPQPNMSEAECQAFVVKAVAHAMARDGSSGGCIRTVVISKDGVKRSFLPGDRIPTAFGELPAPQAGPPVQA